MKKNFLIITVATLVMFVFATCSQTKKNTDPMHTPSIVKIKAVDGKFHFFVNKELFDIKGAGLGNTSLSLMQDAGANSFRTWSPDGAEQILDSAYKYHLMIAMGQSMGQELHGFNYDDTAAVAKQFNGIRKAVDAYKDHPNLLCWVVGNELNLSPGRGKTVNPKVWDALKQVVDYIHKTDPNHPVATAFAGISKSVIDEALTHCPDLDFITVQVYGTLEKLPRMIKAAGISKPFAITEFGPRGHWEVPKTVWGREIEETSAVKATGIYDRIQKGIVSDSSGLCLGGYAFYWGQKQERTPTWYGMFIKSGEATAVVDELTRYWSGKYPAIRAPKVDSMKLADKNAVDNIYLKPGLAYTAKVFATDPNGFPLTFKWVLQKEVIERSQGGAFEQEPDSVRIDKMINTNGELKFKVPKDTGEYRLFSYVFNDKNKVGTANVPFYVKK
jgi:hypothetical protein